MGFLKDVVYITMEYSQIMIISSLLCAQDYLYVLYVSRAFLHNALIILGKLV